MAGDLQGIIDQLVIIQNAITPPTGENDLKCYDEPPTGVLTFPSFVNVEDDLAQVVRASSLRTITFFINMHLLFARADQKYSVRSRRAWIKPVIDAFDDALVLDLAQPPVQYAPIESVSFENVVLPGSGSDQEYIAATFRLKAWLAEAFTFGA